MDPEKLDITIEGGQVTASLDDRTITGLLIPFGEVGRTNAGAFDVQAGAIDLPADPDVVSLNLDHDRMQPVGRATRVWETAKGIMATLHIARTPAGDAALADATSPAGRRRALSAEFTVDIRDGHAAGGVLAAAALVARGAFPSARVLAADQVTTEHTEDTFTDENGVTWTRVVDAVNTVTEPDPTNTDPVDDTNAVDDPSKETEVAASAIPATQRHGAPAGHTRPRGVNLPAVYAAFAQVRNNPTPPADAVAVLAALSDIKIDELTAGGDVLQPNWLGQLYQGIPYTQDFVNLGTTGTSISLAGKKGYKLHRGTAAAPLDRFNGVWAGNKTDINSGTGFTESASSKLFRYAFGNDIAREFFDLPGGADVVEAFFALVAEDELVWSDEIARQTWLQVAGVPTAAGTYPGVDGHDYGSALGMVIQGILAVKKRKSDGRRDTPTFIIANDLAFEELIYTPKDLIPEFVNFTASTDWSGAGDGLQLVVGDTGIEASASVIVGGSQAVQFDQLAGGPLRVDALDLARGGIDRALHGYLQTFVVRPEAVVHIGTPDAWAATTAYTAGALVKSGSTGVLQATNAGTSGATAPTLPAQVGGTVDDGTGASKITWVRIK